MRRNPDAVRSPRRSQGWGLSIAARRRALWRRRGWPRGFACQAGWFLGVDPRVASDLWIAGVYALPPRPRAGVASATGRAFLAALDGLRPWAAMERNAAR